MFTDHRRNYYNRTHNIIMRSVIGLFGPGVYGSPVIRETYILFFNNENCFHYFVSIYFQRSRTHYWNVLKLFSRSIQWFKEYFIFFFFCFYRVINIFFWILLRSVLRNKWGEKKLITYISNGMRVKWEKIKIISREAVSD